MTTTRLAAGVAHVPTALGVPAVGRADIMDARAGDADRDQRKSDGLRRDSGAYRWSPAVREKLVDLRGRVRVDAYQDVAQVREWIDVVQVACRDQRVQASEVVTAARIADEQKVSPTEGNDSQRSLRSVVVERNANVVQEPRECVAAIPRIADRLPHGALGRERILVLLEPSEERIQGCASTRLSELEMSRRAHHGALLRLVLHAIDVEDQVEGTTCLDGMAGQRFEEPASDVREARRTRSAVYLDDAVVAGVRINDECASRAAKYRERRLARAVRRAPGSARTTNARPDPRRRRQYAVLSTEAIMRFSLPPIADQPVLFRLALGIDADGCVAVAPTWAHVVGSRLVEGNEARPTVT